MSTADLLIATCSCTTAPIAPGVARLAPQALIAPLVQSLCHLFRTADSEFDVRQRVGAAGLLKDLSLRAGSAMGGRGSNVSTDATSPHKICRSTYVN